MIYLRQILATKIRSDTIIYTRNVKSVFNGTETVSYRAQTTWNIVPANIKNASLLRNLNHYLRNGNPIIVHVDYAKHILMASGLLT